MGYQCIYNANRLREDIMQRRCSYLLYQLWKMEKMEQNLFMQKKWNEICMKKLAGGKCMQNDCFSRTLKFEMLECIANYLEGILMYIEV
jgi:hypothetical protein